MLVFRDTRDSFVVEPIEIDTERESFTLVFRTALNFSTVTNL